MNMRRYYSWLLLVCVCLFVLFSNSTIAYANLQDSDIRSGNVLYNQTLYVNSNGYTVMGNNYPTNNSSHVSSTLSDYSFNVKYWTTSVSMEHRHTFKLKDSSKMFSKGSNVVIDVTGIVNGIAVDYWGEYGLTYGYNYTFKVYLRDSSGTNISFTPTVSKLNTQNTEQYGFHLELDNIPYDTYAVMVGVCYFPSAYGTDFVESFGKDYSATFHGGFHNSTFSFVEDTGAKTNSLLGSIINWITSLRDSVMNIPNGIVNVLSSFFEGIKNAVINLPTNLKSFFDSIVNGVSSMSTAISNKLQSVMTGIQNSLTTLGNNLLNGIKSLFVPSEQSIKDIREDWEQLLAIRFGALYEVVDLIIEYASAFNSTASVNSVSSSGTITFPVVSVPLGSVSFEFGGWEVDLIPNGFEFLIDSLKLIISVSATILFVNGLKYKFERLVTR